MHCRQSKSIAQCNRAQPQPYFYKRASLAQPWCCRRLTSSSKRGFTLLASADPAPAAAPPSTVIDSKCGDLIWASCVSSRPSVSAAVQEAVDSILEHQDDEFEPDLAIIFASCNYGSQLQDVVSAIRRQVPTVRHVFGCSAFGVLGSSSEGPIEVEGEPGVSLILAALPGVEVSVMHTLRSSIPSEDASPEAWCDLVGMSPVEQLQHSTTASAMATAEEEQEAEQDQEQQQQQQQEQQQQPQQPPASSISKERQQVQEQGDLSNTVSSSSSSSSSSSAADQQQPSSAVSFLVLCDPRFQQSKELLAGLDFAFPTSNKIGAVLSQGQQNKRRLMFVWSADGSVQTGTAAWRRRQRQRRQQQQHLATSSSHDSSASYQSDQVQSQQQQQQRSSSKADQSDKPEAEVDGKTVKKKGLFGSLFDSLLSSLNDEEGEQSSNTSSKSTSAARNISQKPSEFEVLDSSSSSSVSGASAHTESAAADASISDGDSSDDDDDSYDPADASGVFMYGAAVLGLKGPVLLEPITCQGYRTVSNKVWTVGQTSRDGDLIATLIDPDVDADDQEEGEEAEVVPMMALYELMATAGAESAAPEELIEALSSRLAVAIAADSWRPISELQADDFQVCAISEVWQKTGYFRVDGQARPGYRLRMVLRDELGIRDDLDNKLLGLKRAELAGVLSGDRQPPPLGAIMFSDIGRGSSLYDTPNYESGAVSKYLPSPLSGMFGSAQISSVNKKAGLYELATAIGVLRPLAQGTADPY